MYSSTTNLSLWLTTSGLQTDKESKYNEIQLYIKYNIKYAFIWKIIVVNKYTVH